MTATSATCPCCGTAIKTLSLQTAKFAVTPTMAEIIEYLERRMTVFTAPADIAAHVYRRDVNGGPQTATNCISAIISQNRPTLARHGWQVLSRTGPGGGVMLAPLNGDTA